MIPPPPRTTLFPYTTLFRSDQKKPVTPNTSGCEECLAAGQTWVELRMCLVCGHVGCCDSSEGRHATRHFQDRKSTRLNSSHRCISYAVFCLKKKKNSKTKTT